MFFVKCHLYQRLRIQSEYNFILLVLAYSAAKFNATLKVFERDKVGTHAAAWWLHFKKYSCILNICPSLHEPR